MNPQSETQYDGVAHRRDQLLKEEVDPCSDSICCCEAEPRWLKIQDEEIHPERPGEWEGIDRVPREEL